VESSKNKKSETVISLFFFHYLYTNNKKAMSEKELKAACEKYQQTSHPEDRMSYMEFRSEMGFIEE
jgi:hypothetical protein